MFITAPKSPTKEANQDGGITQLAGDDNTVSPIVDNTLDTTTVLDDEPDHPDIDDGDALDQEMETGELEDDMRASESLVMQIEHLQNLAVAIETYGISPGMMLVADRDGLLSSTFIGKVPSTESMTGPYRPDSTTSQAALEGVMDAIKSKTAEWAAKAGGVIKKLVAKAGGMIKSAVDWTSSFGKSIASKTWDATKAAGATIKAHPYKTVAAVLAAIAAVAAVLALIWAFPAQAAQVEAWRKRVVTAVTNIKMPGGKFVTKTALNAKNPNVTPDMIKWAKETFPEPPAKVSVLGWTKNAVTSAAKSLSGALGKVLNAIHAPARNFAQTEAKYSGMRADQKIPFPNFPHEPKPSIHDPKFSDILNLRMRHQDVKIHEYHISKKYANKQAYDATFSKVFQFAVAVTWILISTVVIGGYFLIKKTVSKVVSAVSGASTKEEPATA